MAFHVNKRGKLTCYYTGERPVLSALATEELPDGDLGIYFSGLTGGYSAKGVLEREELVTTDRRREIPLVSSCWEHWLQEAGICECIADVHFVEIHAFGCQPKAPSPLTDSGGYAAEQERLRQAYAQAYCRCFAEGLPDHGLPARLTVRVVDVADRASCYESYGMPLYQGSAQGQYQGRVPPSRKGPR